MTRKAGELPMMNEEKDVFDQSEETPGLKVWFEDNLRILLSILVVVAIAGGIYSYSKRAQAPEVTDTAATQQTETKTDSTETTPGTTDNQATKAATTTPATTAPAAQSSETADAFVVKAVKGQGETHLARQALADFLAKNPDSALTKEHKIYIEDYLRKHNAFTGSVHVGTSVEFQKSLIQTAIGQAKNLNERQLNHLKIYSARVTSMP